MQQQRTMTQAAKLWYDIEVQPKQGRKFWAARHLADKREAEWLVERLKKRAGIG